MSDLAFVDPVEFYRATMADNQVVLQPEDLSKFADQFKIAAPVAELAKRYYEQMQLDGVKYASAEACLVDAVEMAKAYHTHANDVAAEAMKIADGAAEKLAAVAAGLGIEGLRPSEVLYMAAQQVAAAEHFEVVKQAAFAALPEEVKTAWVMPAPAAPAPGGSPNLMLAPHIVNPGASELIAAGMGFAGKGSDTVAAGMLGVPHDQLNDHIAHFARHQATLPAGTSLADAAASFRASNTWWNRNKAMAVPAGIGAAALGAGALYLMKQHSDARKRRTMEEAMAARHAALNQEAH